ncbi:MAG: hypothetical protein K8J09_13105 [Planctomycetes bacterium]|nr:hypothetical protein [Planctomycetota bacterium]MCC7399286.1 hypothetical protein [Planctomycetota bacterium]
MTAPPRGPRPLQITRRLLSLAPTLIAVLWVAGVARFRGYELAPREWAVVVAMAFALHLVVSRGRGPRPLPQLHPDTNPATLAAMAAALFTGVAAAISALIEWLVDSVEPPTTSLGLRVLWHASCCFGACYCTFLPRLQSAIASQRRAPPG